jgi:hypothetical protein
MAVKDKRLEEGSHFFHLLISCSDFLGEMHNFQCSTGAKHINGSFKRGEREGPIFDATMMYPGNIYAYSIRDTYGFHRAFIGYTYGILNFQEVFLRLFLCTHIYRYLNLPDFSAHTEKKCACK